MRVSIPRGSGASQHPYLGERQIPRASVNPRVRTGNTKCDPDLRSHAVIGRGKIRARMGKVERYKVKLDLITHGDAPEELNLVVPLKKHRVRIWSEAFRSVALSSSWNSKASMRHRKKGIG